MFPVIDSAAAGLGAEKAGGGPADGLEPDNTKPPPKAGFDPEDGPLDDIVTFWLACSEFRVKFT
jgi:hypothetical protein